jgi:hypothetical protein
LGVQRVGARRSCARMLLISKPDRFVARDRRQHASQFPTSYIHRHGARESFRRQQQFAACQNSRAKRGPAGAIPLGPFVLNPGSCENSASLLHRACAGTLRRSRVTLDNSGGRFRGKNCVIPRGLHRRNALAGSVQAFYDAAALSLLPMASVLATVASPMPWRLEMYANVCPLRRAKIRSRTFRRDHRSATELHTRDGATCRPASVRSRN